MKAPSALGLAVLLALGTVGTATAADLSGLRDTARSAAIDMDPGDEATISSDNVEYIGTIPIDSPGVGGEVVVRDDLGGTRFFYATGAKGLSIYDVTDPASPVHVSTLPFPHAQNEDLKVSDDGTRAVIAADGAIAVPVMPATTGIHVIDTTDVENPKVIASTNPLVAGSGVGTGRGEHTAVCADAGCEWIYGSSSGRIYDATQAHEGVIADTGTQWNVYPGGTASRIHALNRDADGLVISDSTPRLVLDPREDPAQPAVLAWAGEGDTEGGNLQHNNVRPDAEAWTPRTDADPVETRTIDRSDAVANTISVLDERPVMKPGELLIGNSETNLNRSCSSAGGLSTWSMTNFDQGADLVQLEVFRPLTGNWLDGNPRANGLGCSGHWFTERDGFVTASWYEHGVRFFTVDPEVGTIEQVGFFQPVVTEAGAAYWIDDEYVYSMDYARGLDILRFDRGGEIPTQEEFDASWLANLDRVGALAEAERLWCRLGVSD